MRMRIGIFWILATVAPISPMDSERVPVNRGGIAATLAPLKEEAQLLQKKIKAFDLLMHQKQWDEAVLKKALDQYQELDVEVDGFPLRYESLLSDVRGQHRMDVSAHPVIREHSTLYSEVALGLVKYRVALFHMKKASTAFEDVQLSIRTPELPLSPSAVGTLRLYQNWSFPQYGGLQKYLKRTARLLLKELKEQSLYQDRHEESTQEKQKLEVLESNLEEHRQELSREISQIENRLKKVAFEEGDIQQVYDGYERVSDTKKRLELLKEAALHVSVLTPEIELKKKQIHKKSEQLRQRCSGVIESWDRLGVKNLKEILITFTLAEKALYERAEKKRATQRWFLASWRERWSLPPFPMYHVEQAARLMIWDSQSKPLQEAVRDQAKKYLQQIDQEVNCSAAQKMILLVEEFYEYEKRIAASMVTKGPLLTHDLALFKDKVGRSTEAVEVFKKSLMKKIEEFLRRGV
jgi:hypothetical protein